MLIKIRQLLLPLNYEDKDIKTAVAAKLGSSEDILSVIKIIRRSIDARKRRETPVFSVTAEIEIKNIKGFLLPDNVDIEQIKEKTVPAESNIGRISRKPNSPVVVVGAGPSGLMAALVLAEAGLSPLLIERGSPVKERTIQVSQFWKKGTLNPESNVLFGEGGAGLFSDGKLTSRSKNRSGVRRFLKTLVKCGAAEDILIDAEPHLGSDLLRQIVQSFRKLIEINGGEVRFHSCLEGIHIEKNTLTGIIVNGKEIETEHCVLASGHSARDIYTMLAGSSVMLEPKSFAAGVRLELSQEHINRAQWGRFAGHPRLGAAPFRLTFKKDKLHRACYTFCMCPGGTVISCASSHGALTTNGMSLSKRSGKFGNAAFLVPVDPTDYPAQADEVNNYLAGIEFQEKMERNAYTEAGSDYSLPAAPLSGFLTKKYPDILTSNRSWKRSRPADLHNILPDFICETLSVAIPKMLSLMDGVVPEETLLYAAETRSSSPYRILRNESGESVSVSGLFPSGEGAGYAGGIVSSAVDGIMAAEAVIRSLSS
ncbi:MAG: NAD(P)/FAD-dependent oxidoreductase [Proteobacteria bacterium]|nr:NAD(P)/FAD-dependent oxidoreductase [Pseudomonadota bacterium]